MKRLAVFTICLVFMVGCLSGCTDKVWEETDEIENYGRIIVSPEGVRYHGASIRHIVGFKTEKKLGVASDSGGRVCSIEGADSDMYIAVQDTVKRLFFDATQGYGVCIRSGEEIDYTSTDISEVAFIPFAQAINVSDYSQFAKENGLFGDEAKAAMQGAFDSEGEFADEEYIGELIYRPEGMDWCYLMAFVRYSYEDGFFLIIHDKHYLLPDNTIKALNISL